MRAAISSHNMFRPTATASKGVSSLETRMRREKSIDAIAAISSASSGMRASSSESRPVT